MAWRQGTSIKWTDQRYISHSVVYDMEQTANSAQMYKFYHIHPVSTLYCVTTDNNLVTCMQYGFYKWWKFDSCLLACWFSNSVPFTQLARIFRNSTHKNKHILEETEHKTNQWTRLKWTTVRFKFRGEIFSL